MVIRKCDRCGQTIKNNYWTIDIFEKQDNTMRNSAFGASNNIQENTKAMLNKKEEYCQECIIEIKDVIRTKKEREVKEDEYRR